MITLNIEGADLELEIALTEDQRSRGLSKRTSLDQNQGMVFATPNLIPSNDCFWMQDTWIPLDAVFVDAIGRIIHIAQMEPESTDTHCPPKAATWVIETNQNWFADQGLDVGYVLSDENLVILRSITNKHKE